MPIFSLPSPYGIGTLGKAAKGFVDFLKEAGQSFWQILPIGHTGFGDSPYQSFSSFAGNPYFIDLDELAEAGLLKPSELEEHKALGEIDYGKLFETRYPLFKKAFSRFLPNKKYISFQKENADWLEDYALFMAIKDSKNGCDFYLWEEPLRKREPEALKRAEKELRAEVEFYKTLQFWFFEQWQEIKAYANKNGISIIGDIPIYTARDSADIWAQPEQFQLDKNGRLSSVAGVPPDAFSEDGQLWGNPLYDWNYMKKDNYDWWIRRIRTNAKLFDVVRIDHFRAFDEYFSIPANALSAKEGKWKKGPGIALFKRIKEELGKVNIIAEDLGILTKSVEKLLKKTGYPGMVVLQFAFSPEEESRYLPHNIEKNSVVYTGTHDNNTIECWFLEEEEETTEFCKKYLRLNEQEGHNWGMIKAALASPAETCILSMQDFMGLGSEARINTPSTDSGNWVWRIEGGCLNPWLSGIIREETEKYFRI